jgi:hypothetical protein
MRTFIAWSAFRRVLSLFAGMRVGEIVRDTRPMDVAICGELVSWHPGARSRREDELARSRQIESG